MKPLGDVTWYPMEHYHHCKIGLAEFAKKKKKRYLPFKKWGAGCQKDLDNLLNT